MIKLYISLFLLFSAINLLAQTTVNLNPIADNSIYQDYPGNSNGAGVNIFVGNNAANAPRRALLRFNLSAIPTNVVITNVTLTLNCNRAPQPTNYNLSLYALTQDWGEGSSNGGATNDGDGAPATVNDATWPCALSNGIGGCNTAWSSLGGSYNASPSATSGVGSLGDYTWTDTQLAADVQNWIANPTANFGWILIGDETQAFTVKRFGSRENGTTLQRPSLSVTYNISLPVSLSFFNAQETKTGNLLRWQTVQELNNDYFYIEHSSDGLQFKKLGNIKGHGNSVITNDYQFIHNDYPVGKNYYRLAQVDFNSRVTYSQIIIVGNTRAAAVLFINPNPLTESINLRTAIYSGMHYQVFDVLGRPSLKGILVGSKISLPGQLQAGSYFLIIYKNDGSAISGSFIKL